MDAVPENHDFHGPPPMVIAVAFLSIDHCAVTMPSTTPAKMMPEALMIELSLICVYCPKPQATSILTRLHIHEFDVRLAFFFGVGIGQHEDGFLLFSLHRSVFVVIAEDAEHVLED